MYYCHNCSGRFVHPGVGFAPYPDYGGERYTYCPLCGAPDNFSELTENSKGRFAGVNLTHRSRPLEFKKIGEVER